MKLIRECVIFVSTILVVGALLFGPGWLQLGLLVLGIPVLVIVLTAM